ncbi:MAG TPA: NYN domain-containing protein [Thermoanaerobaculia bacterium]|nr:NYN domain-containing protein [Thermoanaerobaculia bacterium]
MRSALFVDFDNIYLGLQNEDPRAADQFATHPGRWLRWLQEELPNEADRGGRKILLRRCYLNPSQFSRFRPYFIRSAFEVVDCPPLTRGGKTSADIQMVMDVMDALGHETRFEEFIILSGDADFTPVLLRLSRHDRRSVVLAAGPASAAYKAACDLLIDQDTFLEEAIGITDGTSARPSAGSDLLRRIAAKVFERASVSGELVATDLPGIFREFPEFTPDSNWLGFYSLRGLTSAVVGARGDLEMIDGDPWRVRVNPDAPPPPEEELEAAAAATATASGRAPLGAGAPVPRAYGPAGTALASPELLRGIADKVYERASGAGELLATDLPAIYREFPQFTPTSNWLGFYSLRGMSDAVIRSRGDLEMVDGDPWRVRVRQPAAGGASAEPAAGSADSAAQTESEPAPTDAEQLERNRQSEEIVDYVRSLVEVSDSALPMTTAAQMVIAQFGDSVLASRWLGAGTFRDLLAPRLGPGFAVSASRPGYLYDPDRHQTPQEEPPETIDLGDPGLSSLAHRIHRITDTPYLTSAEYGLVFRKIAEEVNEEGYFLTRTSKAVRDRCIEEGTPIARINVNFILRGIVAGGHRFGPDESGNALELGHAFLKNVLGLCESAGMPLSEDERLQVSEWILGDILTELEEPPGEDAAEDLEEMEQLAEQQAGKAGGAQEGGA